MAPAERLRAAAFSPMTGSGSTSSTRPFRSRADLRKHPRIPCREGVNVRVMRDGRVVADKFVMTNDISAEGVGLTYQGHLEPGTRVEVKLCRRDSRQDIVSGTVTRCARVGLGENMIGVRLDRSIDPRLYLSAT